MSSLENSVYRYESLELHILSLRSDNYSYVIRDHASGTSLVIDPSETKAIIDFLEDRKWGLDWILDTHHHNDHIEGNPGLKKHFQAKIAAPSYDIDKGRITGGPDLALREGENFSFGEFKFRVIETPGHTLGHVSLFLEGAQWLFSGDTLFSLGCGRLFEGDAPMLWQSFQKLRKLPDESLVFCGHEYTLANAVFVESLDLDLESFQEFHEGLKTRLKEEKRTIPSRLYDEKRFNPYFLAKDSKTFGTYRKLKDNF